MSNFIINVVHFFKILLIFVFSGTPTAMLWVALAGKNRTRKNKALKKLGKRIVKALERSGPTFIKLGQILSTRPDLTGEVLGEELSQLQDKLPPFDYEEVKKTIESELNAPISEHFQHINERPVAAASIAQVHKAKTQKGETVAIKVLRPKIEAKFERDLKMFRLFAKLFEFFSSTSERLKPTEVVETLSETVKFELDLRFEAASADKLRNNCKNDAGIYIPKVFWKNTARRILTLEWIEGIPVHDREKLLDAGHDLHEVAKKLAVTFFNQAYRDGFFHADLHPGNLFVNKNGDIVMVDFGIIGILNQRDRLFVAEMIHGFITQDYQRVSDLHFEAGYVPPHKDRILFALACRSIGEPIIGQPVNKISIAKLLKQLFDISASFDMQTQTQLLLLQKTMMTIEGVGYTIYPEVNMWQLAEPWIKDWAEKNFGIKASLNDIKNDFKKFSSSIPHTLSQASDLISKLDDCITTDGIKIHPDCKKKAS